MLFIHNDIVKSVLSMKDCIEIQEEAFKAMETGGAIHRPRIDLYTPTERTDGYYRWGTMEGWYDGILAIRMKSDVTIWPRTDDGAWTEEKYCMAPGTFCGLIMLFSSRNGEPLAMINDGVLQHMRVGAGAGIGVKYLAREDATTVGMLGSGGMARTYLEAFCAVRPIKSCKVHSPTKTNRETYAREMSEKLGIEVIPVDSGREAARGVDILSSATDSMLPTFEPGWIEPGMHVTNIRRNEVSPEAEARFDVKIRQGVNGLKMTEAGRIEAELGVSPGVWVAGNQEELKRLPLRTTGIEYGRNYPDFRDLVNGRAKGRTSPQQVTFYLNLGNQGLQFAAVGGLVYKKVLDLDVGRKLPTDWFVQDIRD